MALAFHEFSHQKLLHHQNRLLGGSIIRGNRQHIYIIVLSCRVRLIRLKSQTASDFGNFISRDTYPRPAAANQTPPVFPWISGHLLAHHYRPVHIIILMVVLKRAHIPECNSPPHHPLVDLRLMVKPPMVSSDIDHLLYNTTASNVTVQRLVLSLRILKYEKSYPHPLPRVSYLPPASHLQTRQFHSSPLGRSLVRLDCPQHGKRRPNPGNEIQRQ